MWADRHPGKAKKELDRLSPRLERFLIARLADGFEGTDDQEVQRWRGRLRHVELAAGELLMTQGDQGDSAAELEQGLRPVAWCNSTARTG